MKENSTKTEKIINRKVLIIVLSCVLALVIVAGALATLTASGDGVIKGVTVEGTDVAGMGKDELKEYINNNLMKDITEGEAVVHFNGADYKMNYTDVILGYDVVKTAEIAYGTGRDGNFFVNMIDRLGARFGGKNIVLEPMINTEYVDTFADEMCKSVEPRKVDDYYFMDGDRLKLVFGSSGNFVDEEKFKTELIGLLRNGESGEISVEVVAADPEKFDVNEIYEKIATQPTNTYYEEIEGKKYIKQAKNGYDFDKNKLKEAIDKNIGKNDSFYFDLEVIPPEVTELNEAGLFTETLAKYTSRITDQNESRLTNVHLAASKINGVIINPGETFAYLSYVEPITVEGGYKVANVYANGKITQDVGGGVCQVSSALYSAVLYADLDVIKRYAHSLTVGYVPYGQDATVSSGEIDFRFVNNTNEPIKIIASSDNAGVYITLKGKKLNPSVTVELENITTQVLAPETVVTPDPSLSPGKQVVDYAGKTGYVVDTYKLYYKDGELIEKKHITTSIYKKIDKTVRQGPDLNPEQANPEKQPGLEEVPTTTVPETVIPETPAVTEPVIQEPATDISAEA